VCGAPDPAAAARSFMERIRAVGEGASR